MTKKFMPQDVFEYGVCTIAKSILSETLNGYEVTEMIWIGYEKSIIDDGVKDDMYISATESIDWLKENNAPDIYEFIHHFQWFCMNFDQAGKPRKKKFFNGLWFAKSNENINRISDFKKKIQAYYFLAKSGLAKLAPEDWDPSR